MSARVSGCQQCRKEGKSSSIKRAQEKGPFGLVIYACSKEHRWAECPVHDFRVRALGPGYDFPRTSPKSWCYCAPPPPKDDGMSTWVEVTATVTGNYGSREWTEVVPRSLLDLLDLLNPTFYFNSLDGKHADVDKKYHQIDVDVESADDEDLEVWFKSYDHDQFGEYLDGDEECDSFRLFHSKWSPDADIKELAKECGFIVSQ